MTFSSAELTISLLPVSAYDYVAYFMQIIEINIQNKCLKCNLLVFFLLFFVFPFLFPIILPCYQNRGGERKLIRNKSYIGEQMTAAIW